MNFEDFIKSKSEGDSPPTPLMIPPQHNNRAKVDAMWVMFEQLIHQGVSRPELVKIIDICNMNEYFELDRAVTLLADLSLETYEKEKRDE